MIRNVLQEFQEFLHSRRLVQQKYIPYYAYWASKFMSFSNKRTNINNELCVKEFLNQLQSQGNIADWQVKQADNALKLYIHHYPGHDKSILSPDIPNNCKKIQNIPQIIDELRRAIRIKHYSYSTERTYINWVKRFFYYVLNEKKKDIQQSGISSDDVKDYLSYLALKKRVTASTQNQAFNSLLFLFRDVLKLELNDLSKTVRAKRGQRLPVVLSIEEVVELLRHVKGVTGLVLQLIYGAGLRLMDAARLRVKDVDFGSDLLFVRDGKGNKDRTTILPELVKKTLKLHLEEVKSIHENDLKSGYGKVYLPNALERKYPNASKEWHWQYVFPSVKLSADPRNGKIRRHHIHEKTIQSALKSAVKKAGIPKHVSVHTLRHSFATHLLMNGVNIREIQQLLGHKNVETTMIYTHVLRDISKVPQSPLDSLHNSG
jgi:integron integrase